MKEVREDAMKHFKQTKDNTLCLLLGDPDVTEYKAAEMESISFKLKVNRAQIELSSK